MIILNKDGKGPVIIKTWAEVLERPGFKSEVKPDEIELKEIIARYFIDPGQPCGLSNCRTKHKRGYLVVAEDGSEANIGNVCGKKLFGISFQDAERRFKIDVNAYRYREKIQTFQNRIDNYETKIKSLIHGDQGGDWCYERMHSYMSRLFDGRTSEALIKRARLKQGTVTKDILLTKEEREMMAGAGNKSPAYRTESLFTIAGIQAVIDYKKLKPLMNTVLTKEREAFKTLNPGQLNYSVLQFWSNWVNKFERRIVEVENIIEDCSRFLLRSNIENINNYKQYL